MLEIVNTIAQIILGLTAIFSLWLSRKALKESGWDSAMNTSPSIMVRPREIQLGIKKNDNSVWSVGSKKIKKDDSIEIAFTIEFVCLNVGRGVAFNIAQPKSIGMDISDFYNTPLYLTADDNSFTIQLKLVKKFSEWYSVVSKNIPVSLELYYTNDQGNVYCKSFWRADIKPLEIDGDDLAVRDTRLLHRQGGVQYSAHPIKRIK